MGVSLDVMDLVDGRFHVQDTVGKGGMGEVVKVLDTASDEILALKYCTSEDKLDKRRFAREVRMMSDIEHTNVMPIVFHNLDHSPPYFLMPLADHSLQDELEGTTELEETEEAFSEDSALEIFREICKGIQAVHNAQATHRDIKPGNIMRLEDSSLVVSDLGLAKQDDRDTTILTATRAAVGTRIYMAPEQFGGSREADQRADIYQLGKTLYQLITGKLPLYIDSSLLPDGLDYIVDKATKQNPDQRYQTVGGFMDAIESHLRATRAGANPEQEYDAAIQEADSLALSQSFKETNAKAILALIMRFSEDSEVFIEQFDRIPIGLLGAMAQHVPDELTAVLGTYCNAIENEISGFSFSYAEVVAAKMRIVYDMGHTEHRITAIRATMIASVALNRYAAMEVFDKMLTDIKSPKDAIAVADMLRSNKAVYQAVYNRVSRTRLTEPIRTVYDEVASSSDTF